MLPSSILCGWAGQGRVERQTFAFRAASQARPIHHWPNPSQTLRGADLGEDTRLSWAAIA
jgi:hypothetical protein